MERAPRDSLKYSGVLIGILGISFSSILIRWSDAPVLAVLTYRTAFACLILLPLVLRSPDRMMKNAVGVPTLIMLLAGFLFGVHLLAFMLAVDLTSITAATVLVNCHPLVVAVVGMIWLKERSKFIEFGIVLGMVGILIISLGDVGGHQLSGDLLALTGGVLTAMYLLLGRFMRKSVNVITYALFLHLAAFITILVWTLASNVPLWPYPVEEIVIALALAIIPSILGHTVLTWLLGFMHAAFVSLVMLGEPVVASILAFILLSEIPSAWAMVGGAMVLLGILMTATMDFRYKRLNGSLPGP
jgi:drug/metabolite transporter (DMT)-like permease